MSDPYEAGRRNEDANPRWNGSQHQEWLDGRKSTRLDDYQPHHGGSAGGLAIIALLVGVYEQVSATATRVSQSVSQWIDWNLVELIRVATLLTVICVLIAAVSTLLTWPLARVITAKREWSKSLWKLSFITMAIAVVMAMGVSLGINFNLEALSLTAKRSLFVAATLAIVMLLHVLMFHRHMTLERSALMGLANIGGIVVVGYFLLPVLAKVI